MTLDKERKTIGIFANYSDTQLVLQELKAANFPMHKVSVIARDGEESDIAGVDVKEDTGNTFSEDTGGGFISGALRGVTNLLVGLVLWAIPGIGRVILAGAEVTAIATTLADDAINAATGGLHCVLLNLGIPKEQAQNYSDLVYRGYYLVIATGIDIEIRVAKRVFNRRDIQKWGTYEPYFTPNSRYKNAVGNFFYTPRHRKSTYRTKSSWFFYETSLGNC